MPSLHFGGFRPVYTLDIVMILVLAVVHMPQLSASVAWRDVTLLPGRMLNICPFAPEHSSDGGRDFD